jgi:hypothetical protein
MKKKVMIAAAIAVMAGAGAYFGNASNSPSSDGRSDLLLENAEALSDMEIELPEVPIFCNAGGYGRCWEPWYKPVDILIYGPCRYTGYTSDFCGSI